MLVPDKVARDHILKALQEAKNDADVRDSGFPQENMKSAWPMFQKVHLFSALVVYTLMLVGRYMSKRMASTIIIMLILGW